MINSTPENVPVGDTLSVKFSLRNKLLILLLGVTVGVFAAVAYLSITSIQNIGQTAQQVSSDALRTQAEAFLVEVALDNARENDEILQKIQTDAVNTAQYAASVFSNPQAFATGVSWSADEKMFFGPEEQYINGPDDTSSVFVPNTVAVDENIKDTLELAAYLDSIFVPIYENDENSVAIYLTNKSEITRFYPNVGLGEFVPANFEATKDIFFTSGAPENNPNGQAIWTPVYDDPAGQGLLVSTVAPIYLDNGEFFGIIGIDVSLENLTSNIGIRSEVSGAYSFLIDDQGRAIALPEQGYQDILGRDQQAGEAGPTLDSPISGFNVVLTDMQNGGTGFATITANDGRELFVSYAPLENTGWSFGTVVEAESVLQTAAQLEQNLADATTDLIVNRLIPAGIVIFIVIVVLGLVLTNRLVNPLRQLAVAARQIGNRQWNTPLPTTNDEVGLVSNTLRLMATQLQELFDTLEDQISSRTQRLRSVAALGERLNSILSFDELLVEVVNQIKEEFDYYHVHIYIFDEQRQDLIMTAGVGEAGAQMKARGHKISRNAPSSLVARAARSATIVNVADVRESPDWLPNPLLPDTRAEMAVPIIVEDRVAGVLDVQQDEVAGLDEGDINLLRSVAIQIAVAMRNAQLFEEVEKSLAESRTMQEYYMQESWQSVKLSAQSQQYVYVDPKLGEAAEAKQANISKAKPQVLETNQTTLVTVDGENDSRKAVIAPVSVRGRPIGALQLQPGRDGYEWSEQDLAMIETIVNQMAQAAENLRLFDETRQRAGQEAAIREITDKLRAASNIDVLLETAARELGSRLGVQEASLKLGVEPTSSTGDTNGNGKVGIANE